jgi:hypothetical protein
MHHQHFLYMWRNDFHNKNCHDRSIDSPVRRIARVGPARLGRLWTRAAAHAPGTGDVARRSRGQPDAGPSGATWDTSTAAPGAARVDGLGASWRRNQEPPAQAWRAPLPTRSPQMHFRDRRARPPPSGGPPHRQARAAGWWPLPDPTRPTRTWMLCLGGGVWAGSSATGVAPAATDRGWNQRVLPATCSTTARRSRTSDSASSASSMVSAGTKRSTSGPACSASKP